MSLITRLSAKARITGLAPDNLPKPTSWSFFNAVTTIISSLKSVCRHWRPMQMRQKWFSFAFVVCLSFLVTVIWTQPSSEETDLRTRTKRFFEAFQKEDLDSLMQFWSARSPELQASKTAFQKMFTLNDKIEIKNLGQPGIRIGENEATVRVRFELSAIKPRTGKPSPESGRHNRTFAFVKEAEGWKIQEYKSSEAILAPSLLATKEEKEQRVLLEAEKELVTSRLVQALLFEGQRLSATLRYSQAFDACGLALNIAEQLHDPASQADALRGIGNIHFHQGNHRQAMEQYQKSLSISEKIDNRGLIARALNNIANIQSLRGNYAQALQYYQKSLSIRKEIDDTEGIGDSLANIGNVLRTQGNYRQALDHYQMSIEIRKEIDDLRGIAQTLNNIGIVCRFQGDHPRALENYEASLRIKEESGDKRGIAMTVFNIGSVLYLDGNYTDALTNFENSLTISYEISAKDITSATLNKIGDVYRLRQDYARALEHYENSLKISRELSSKEAIVETLSNIGRVHESQGKHVEARKDFARAIAVVEELRINVAGDEQEQQLFFRDKLFPYHRMIRLLIDKKRSVEALGYAERIKGRALLDVLESGRVEITKAMTQEERAEEQRLKEEIVSVNKLISRQKLSQLVDRAVLTDLEARQDKARANYEAFQLRIYAAHSGLEIQRGNMRPVNLEQAGSLIKTDGAVLEFVVTEDKTFLFTLTPQHTRPPRRIRRSGLPPLLKVHVLNIKQRDLAKRVERFRRTLTDRDLDFDNEARELYDLLIGPARKELTNKTSLTVVPDGPLWELPFQALQAASKKFLIEDHAVSYAPSLTTLFHMTKSGSRRTTPATLFALGNPALWGETAGPVPTGQPLLMDERLGPLPESERLVNTVAQMYGPARSRVYVGISAQESRVKAEAANYEIIHIAAHGILNDKSPMYSHLVLSQTERNPDEDGLLEAWEIMNLDLNANLVILSACETARGDIGNGEGVIGLSWASFVAGAPATIVSQWKVETGSTTELMIEFHRNFMMEKSKAQALRLAALKLSRTEQYRHPFYWAGFVIIGNAR